MGKVALTWVLSALVVWNQPGATQVVTAASSAPIRGQSKSVAGNVHRVTGCVVDDVTGKPLSGARVTLTTVSMQVSCIGCGVQPVPPPPAPPRVKVTGSDGRFAFEGVPEKTIQVTAAKAGYLDVMRPRIDAHVDLVALTNNRDFVLRLAPAASIRGVARDHTGAPLEDNGDIALSIVTYWNGWPHTQYVGPPKGEADGTWRFDDLEPGRYFILASPPRGRPQPERTEDGRAIGEVPVRYPAPGPGSPSPFFTLHEGEQKKIDLQIPERTLHHVTMTAGPAHVSEVFSVGGGGYLLQEVDREKGTYEVWLPDGMYWPTNRRPGEIDGPIPFEVAGADVSGLRFASAPMRTTRLPVTVQPLIDGSPDLQCGPFASQLCFIATLYLLYLDPDGSTDVASSVRLTASTQPIAITLLPGRYAAVLLAQRDLYAKSIRDGAADLSREPLLIHQGEPPAPIQVELAQAGKVDGVVQRNGKHVAAYVYALPEGDVAEADYRLFAPVEAKDDGTFEVGGLAPGTWVFFATDVELSLDVHDPADTTCWRDHGSVVHVETGQPAHLVLEETPAPVQ